MGDASKKKITPDADKPVEGSPGDKGPKPTGGGGYWGGQSVDPVTDTDDATDTETS